MKISKIVVKKFLPSGDVEITHGQTLRQSQNYNSFEASYGIKFSAKISELPQAIKFAEETVEAVLIVKANEQRNRLEGKE